MAKQACSGFGYIELNHVIQPAYEAAQWWANQAQGWKKSWW